MPSSSTWWFTAALLLEDIGPRRRRPRRMTRAAQGGGRRQFVARAVVEPVAPMEPPAPLVLLAVGEEGVRAGLPEQTGRERGFRIAGRIEQALQMAAVRQDEGRVVAHDL